MADQSDYENEGRKPRTEKTNKNIIENISNHKEKEHDQEQHDQSDDEHNTHRRRR